MAQQMLTSAAQSWAASSCMPPALQNRLGSHLTLSCGTKEIIVRTLIDSYIGAHIGRCDVVSGVFNWSMHVSGFQGSVSLQAINARSKWNRPKLYGTGRLSIYAMRAVIQRVRSASVEVDGKLISSIGPGLLCLIGIRDTDTIADQEYL